MSKTPFIRLALIGASVATIATAIPASAQGRGWETIGSRRISGAIDRETINVRGNERFRSLRMCASRRAVRVLGANVDFANGTSQDLNARSILSPGECTRPIDLVGKRRDITRVRLTYAKFNLISKPAMLTVQAR
jgi:hypothetical protein